MPGRIVDMSSSTNTNGINGVGALGKPGATSPIIDTKSQHQTPLSSHKSNSEQTSEGGAVNRTTDLPTSVSISGFGNGVSQDATTNGVREVEMGGTHGSNVPTTDSPPELVHITDGYVSLGSLIERVMQQSFVDFTTLVENSSQLPVLLTNAAIGINGLSSSLANGTSHSVPIHQKNNTEKRINWIEWTRVNRDKFIKLLITAQWAKANSKSIQVLIDLKRWSDLQDAGFYDAAVSIGQLKRDLFPFRLRNPDIKTALDILATGKDSRMPDLDMLPLTSLTNEKMLRTLRNLNALLRIRLTLHEDLPWHLRRWKVGDGRATFSSKDDFEFDITIADEEPSKQLYFVDMRFLFSPAPIIGDNRIRDMIQYRADEALSISGISGCFDFLRNFVLTHKITTLQTQSIKLANTSWTGNLKIEMVHRWLIIQYWTNEHYPKSWIELGISSETSQRSLPGHTVLPRIRSRWRRFGKLVEDEELDLRLETIDAEDILRRAITKHSLLILQSTERNLREVVGSSENLHMVLEESTYEPTDCKLRLRLGKHSSGFVFSIEPITGRLCLSPSSEISGRAQFELNRLKNPLDKAYATIETFLCFEKLSRIGRQAVVNAWEPVRAQMFTSDYLSSRLKHRIVQYGAFKPAWWVKDAQNWMLIVTVNLESESWWAVEVLSSASANTLGDVHNMDFSCDDDYINVNGFRNIEQASVRSLTLGRTVRELQQTSIHVGIHWVTQAIPEQYRIILGQGGQSQSEEVPTLTILASEVIKSISAMTKPHPQNFQFILGRYNSQSGNVTAIVRGNLPWTSQVSDMISTTFDPSVSFSAQGNFTLQLEAPIGASFHSYMIERLNLLVRATSFLTSLKAHHITPTNSTISQITFHYSNSSSPAANESKSVISHNLPLSCEITFSPDAAAAPSIRFLPSSKNPHLRIRDSLAELFAKKSANNFLALLQITLPLLRALERVETRGNTIRYWSIMKYRIVYRAAATVFEIVCKPTGGSAEFHVYETRAGGNNANSTISRPQGYEEMMRNFFSKSSTGIRSLKSMLVCDSESIERAIDELDKLVRDKIASAPLVGPNTGLATATGPSAAGVTNGSFQQRPQIGAGRGGMSLNPAAQQRLQQQRLAQQQQQQQQHRAAGNRGPGSNHVVVLD